MATFLVAFSIKEDPSTMQSNESRQSRFIATLENHCEYFWDDIKNLIIFESPHSIEEWKKKLSECIDQRKDIFFIHELGERKAHMSGKYEHNTVFDLIPYLNRV